MPNADICALLCTLICPHNMQHDNYEARTCLHVPLTGGGTDLMLTFACNHSTHGFTNTTCVSDQSYGL